MLKRIEVKNFKSLKHIDFKCAGLNLLMGLNGAGKSSFMQLLFILRVAALHLKGHNTSRVISLQDSYGINIGGVDDLKYSYAGKNEDVDIEVSFCSDEKGDRHQQLHWIFEKSGANELEYSCEDFVKRKQINDALDSVRKLLSDETGKITEQEKAKARIEEKMYEQEWKCLVEHFFNQTIDHENLWRHSQIVLSDRGRPRQVYDEVDQAPWISPDSSNLGEYLSVCANHLPVGGIHELSPMLYPGSSIIGPDGFAKGNELPRQVELWMNVISPGAQFVVDKANVSDKIKYVVSVSFKGASNPQQYRPQNVGFGITNVAPVIVALLTAESKSIVLIENPEAHLHPKGQAAMGNLIARAVASGVQVFVETHSDHVINGIRSAVKDGIVKPSDVNIAFFERKEHDVPNDDGTSHQEIYSEVRNIRVDKNGSLSEYPDGFLDEWNNQLMELI